MYHGAMFLHMNIFSVHIEKKYDGTTFNQFTVTECMESIHNIFIFQTFWF